MAITHFYTPSGVYGVPLELLTERDGVESTLGVSRNPVRIPIFLDDVITAMRQMGKILTRPTLTSI